METVNNRCIIILLEILNEIRKKISNLSEVEAQLRHRIQLLKENGQSKKMKWFSNNIKEEMEKITHFDNSGRNNDENVQSFLNHNETFVHVSIVSSARHR